MKRPLTIAIVAGFAVTVGIVFTMIQKRPESTPVGESKSVAQREPVASNPVAQAASSPASTPVPSPTELSPEEAEARMVAITALDKAPAPTPDAPLPVDPESQPRAFKTDKYEGLDSVPAGYALSNVVLTPEGFALDPNAPVKDGIRSGTLTSNAKPTGFPSNAFVPMWKENLPEGTSLSFEFQLSPDGENWGNWTTVEVDAESMRDRSTTMPDGSPNPNAEYVLGGLHAWPVDQWNQIRYRVTMSSPNAENPVLSEFRFYHMDSTMGEGRLAVVQTPAP